MDDPHAHTRFVTRLIARGLCAPDALDTPPGVDPALFTDRQRLREETASYTTRQEIEALLDAMDVHPVSVQARQGVRRRLVALCARWRRAGTCSRDDLEAALELVESRTA